MIRHDLEMNKHPTISSDDRKRKKKRETNKVLQDSEHTKEPFERPRMLQNFMILKPA